MNTRRPVVLQLPAHTGVAESEQLKIHNKWDTLESVEGDLAMKGFVPMPLPEFECPQVTEAVLTTADNASYTQSYARQLSWLNYASQTLSQVTAMLLQIVNEMEMIAARMRKQFRENARNGGDKMTQKEMDDEVLTDPRYSELKLAEQNFSQRKIELTAFNDGIERGLRVISRQVEIRRMEIEQNKVNIPGRAYPMPGR